VTSRTPGQSARGRRLEGSRTPSRAEASLLASERLSSLSRTISDSSRTGPMATHVETMSEMGFNSSVRPKQPGSKALGVSASLLVRLKPRCFTKLWRSCLVLCLEDVNRGPRRCPISRHVTAEPFGSDSGSKQCARRTGLVSKVVSAGRRSSRCSRRRRSPKFQVVFKGQQCSWWML